MAEPVSSLIALAYLADTIRENSAALVAGLMNDGFTDEQARAIVAGYFAVLTKKPAEE